MRTPKARTPLKGGQVRIPPLPTDVTLLRARVEDRAMTLDEAWQLHLSLLTGSIAAIEP